MANRKRIFIGILSALILCDGMVLEASGIEPVASGTTNMTLLDGVRKAASVSRLADGRLSVGGKDRNGTPLDLISPYSRSGRIANRQRLNHYLASAAELNSASAYSMAGRMVKRQQLNRNFASGTGFGSASLYSTAGRVANRRLLREGREARPIARISIAKKPRRIMQKQK